MGHNVRPYCDFGALSDRLRFYTLLRDPVDRYVSDYFMHVRGGFRGCFTDWSAFDMQHNLLVRSLSARGDVEEAKDVLLGKLVLYDTLDNFDRFVGRVGALPEAARLCRDYRLVNDAPSSHAPPDATEPAQLEQLRSRAADLNRLDTVFYERAVTRLSRTEAANGAATAMKTTREAGTRPRLNLAMNLLARNFLYKPSCGLWPGEVDSIAKYREPWRVEMIGESRTRDESQAVRI